MPTPKPIKQRDALKYLAERGVEQPSLHHTDALEFYVNSAIPFLKVAVSERWDSEQMQSYKNFVNENSSDSFAQFRALRVAFEKEFRPTAALAYDKTSWILYLNLLREAKQPLPERDTSLEFLSSTRQTIDLSLKLEIPSRRKAK